MVSITPRADQLRLGGYGAITSPSASSHYSPSLRKYQQRASLPHPEVLRLQQTPKFNRTPTATDSATPTAPSHAPSRLSLSPAPVAKSFREDSSVPSASPSHSPKSAPPVAITPLSPQPRSFRCSTCASPAAASPAAAASNTFASPRVRLNSSLYVTRKSSVMDLIQKTASAYTPKRRRAAAAAVSRDKGNNFPANVLIYTPSGLYSNNNNNNKEQLLVAKIEADGQSETDISRADDIDDEEFLDLPSVLISTDGSILDDDDHDDKVDNDPEISLNATASSIDFSACMLDTSDLESSACEEETISRNVSVNVSGSIVDGGLQSPQVACGSAEERSLLLSTSNQGPLETVHHREQAPTKTTTPVIAAAPGRRLAKRRASLAVMTRPQGLDSKDTVHSETKSESRRDDQDDDQTHGTSSSSLGTFQFFEKISCQLKYIIS